MTTQELKDRTKRFAIAVARFCVQLNEITVYKPYANQLIRASSSVGANYRAACRAKSSRDFINKLKIVEEECDECLFFLELISELEPSKERDIRVLLLEGDELLSIFVASINTSRAKSKKSKIEKI